MQDDAQLLTTLLQQEAELQFPRFDNDTALRLGMFLVEVAQLGGKAVTIDISRNGQQLFHCALSGTSADNDAWVRRKSNVVTHFGHSSLYMGTHYRARGTTFEASARLDPAQYAAHGGAFPVIVRGTGPVGVVAVSGLPQIEDHDLLVNALREFLRGEQA